MIEFPNVINCDGFNLEKVEPSFDVAKYLFNIVDSQREYLGKWLIWVEKSNKPEDMYDHLNKASKTNNGSYYIVLDGKIIGSVGLGIISETHKIGEIGYWLSKDYNGRGIMTNAVKTLSDFGFNTLGLDRIEILVDTENRASQAVAERAGFEKESVSRHSFILHGKSRDNIVFVKFRKGLENA